MKSPMGSQVARQQCELGLAESEMHEVAHSACGLGFRFVTKYRIARMKSSKKCGTKLS
jgi:hypothetical protein